MVDGPIGFIGTGNIGTPMAANLILAGYELHVYDLDPTRCEALLELGAELGGSPRELAESCSLLMTSLPGPPEVEEVLLGAEGILKGASPGAIYVDLSTNLPSVVSRLAAAAADAGVTMLDAPVSGGVAGAEEATLAVMVGGDEAAFEQCRPLFEAIGENVFYMGASGQGALVKLINNQVSLSARQVVVEALVLARKAGLDPAKAHAVMAVSSAGPHVGRSERLLAREFDAPTFTLQLAAKDLGLAQQVARDAGAPAPLAAAAFDALVRALGRGYGGLGTDATTLVYEEGAGLDPAMGDERAP